MRSRVLAPSAGSRGHRGDGDDVRNQRAFAARLIERLSADFRRYERIHAIALLSEDFTQENEMLTPSLKLRRSKIVARWAQLLESLYRE